MHDLLVVCYRAKIEVHESKLKLELTPQSNLPGEDQGKYPICFQLPKIKNFFSIFNAHH